MKSILELLSNFYWLSIPETIVESLWHADWQRSYERGGFLGMLAETGSSILGTNSWPFFVPTNSTWSAADIDKLLAQYGIETWGHDWANGELFFRVPKDKAPWAQHLLLSSGVPLQHRLLAEKPSKRRRKTDASAPATGRSLDEWARQTETGIDRAIDGIASSLGL